MPRLVCFPRGPHRAPRAGKAKYGVVAVAADST